MLHSSIDAFPTARKRVCFLSLWAKAVHLLQEWALRSALARLPPLLPLIFHPLTMVRRAIAVFLTPLLFLPPCQLIDPAVVRPRSGSDGAAAASASSSIALFTPFTATHYLPLPSASLPLPPSSDQAPAHSSVIASLLSCEGQDKIHMVGLLLSLKRLVGHVVRGVPDGDADAKANAMSRLLDHLPGVRTMLANPDRAGSLLCA